METVMYKNDAIKHFGTGVGLADALKISSASISQWGNVIPEKQALRLDRLTNGSLKYNPALYKQVGWLKFNRLLAN